MSTPFEKPPQVKPQLTRTPDQTQKSFEGQNKDFIAVAEDRGPRLTPLEYRPPERRPVRTGGGVDPHLRAQGRQPVGQEVGGGLQGQGVVGQERPVDPWGYAYGYNSDGTYAPLIWSTAGTTKGETNKWITSWPKM